MAGLGEMFGQSLAAVNGQKPRNSDRIQAGQPLNLRGAFEAAQNIPVAGDVLSGVMAAYDAAKGDYGSAAMNALGVLPFVSGTFIGKGAKTWDAVKAADAEKRIAAGDDVRKVWKETGTFKGPDGHLRQEIPDNNARLTQAFDDLEYSRPDKLNYKVLASVLDHKQLFEAYPELTKTQAYFGDLGDSVGVFRKDSNDIGFGHGADLNTALHEIQHAIQHKEGFATGGNASLMDYGDYRRLPGEVEARNVEARSSLDRDGILYVPPYQSLEEYTQRFGKQVPKVRTSSDTKDADINANTIANFLAKSNE